MVMSHDVRTEKHIVVSTILNMRKARMSKEKDLREKYLCLCTFRISRKSFESLPLVTLKRRSLYICTELDIDCVSVDAVALNQRALTYPT